MCASPTCSHIAVTSLVRPNEEEVEVKLAVYTMPVEAWLSELPHVQPASQISVTSQKVRTEAHRCQPRFMGASRGSWGPAEAHGGQLRLMGASRGSWGPAEAHGGQPTCQG